MINQDITRMNERALLTAKNDMQVKLRNVQARLKIHPYNTTDIQQCDAFTERLNRINDKMRQRFHATAAQ